MRPALAVLDSGADVSSIPDPVVRQLKTRLPDVQIPMPLEEGSRNVRLPSGHTVILTHKTVALSSQSTLHAFRLCPTLTSMPSYLVMT